MPLINHKFSSLHSTPNNDLIAPRFSQIPINQLLPDSQFSQKCFSSEPVPLDKGRSCRNCGSPDAVSSLSEEDRKANIAMKHKYYDLTSRLYERWGFEESIHSAPRWKGETLRESLKRHHHFLALQLGLKPGQKVLDVGCGFGGPLREIARFSSTSITGLNNSEYQITRGKALNRAVGLDDTCDFMLGDFMKMPFPDKSFDAVYAIEATSYAPDQVACYKEIYRVLKPGQYYAGYEGCMTDSFDPNNEEHQKIKTELEISNGLPNIRLAREYLEALETAGFEVIRNKNLAEDSPFPWYWRLDKSKKLSFSSFHSTAIGCFFDRNVVKALEYVRLAPEGSHQAQLQLERAADAMVAGAKKGIFTTTLFVLARKPQ